VLAFRLGLALITFAAGFEFHQVVDRIAAIVINDGEVINDEPFLSVCDSATPEFIFDKSPTAISLVDDRLVYLGKKLVGTPDDTRKLEEQLARESLEETRSFADSQCNDLQQNIRLRTPYRMIYIKAVPESSTADINRLVQAARAAGAYHIGLVPYRRLGVLTECPGRFQWDGTRFRCLNF